MKVTQLPMNKEESSWINENRSADFDASVTRVLMVAVDCFRFLILLLDERVNTNITSLVSYQNYKIFYE